MNKGDIIKIQVDGILQVHTITRTTKTHAYYPGGSIAKNCLCQIGNDWLEMSPPDKEKIKVEPKPPPAKKEKKPQETTIVIDGVNFVSALGAFRMGAATTKTVYHFYKMGWLKMQMVGGVMYFRMSDVFESVQKRSKIGRMIDGKQFYTTGEISKRIGISARKIAQWAQDEKVDCVREDGALLVLSWSDIQQHLKVGRKKL